MKLKYKITQEQFDEIESLFTDNGGEVYGNNKFEIKGVRGRYLYEDGTLGIILTDKPFFVSWDFVEDKLDGYIENL